MINSLNKIQDIWSSYGSEDVGCWSSGFNTIWTYRLKPLRQYVPLKLWYLPSSPHSFTTQNTNIDNNQHYSAQVVQASEQENKEKNLEGDTHKPGNRVFRTY
jgi:hypothetical protein